MPTPDLKPRNTTRAQSLRRQATPAERELWRHLARSQLGAKFSRQMPVGPFFADFLCRELKLVVELDGFSHDIAPDRDASRDRWIEWRGHSQPKNDLFLQLPNHPSECSVINRYLLLELIV